MGMGREEEKKRVSGIRKGAVLTHGVQYFFLRVEDLTSSNY